MGKLTVNSDELCSFLSGDVDEIETEQGVSIIGIEKKGKWETVYKYETQEVILNASDGLYYRARISRSGSYFSHYEYEYPDTLYQVAPVTVEVIDWQTVED